MIILFFSDTNRGHQIPLQMVGSHHVVARKWTQDLGRAVSALNHWAISPARCDNSMIPCSFSKIVAKKHWFINYILVTYTLFPTKPIQTKSGRSDFLSYSVIYQLFATSFLAMDNTGYLPSLLEEKMHLMFSLFWIQFGTRESISKSDKLTKRNQGQHPAGIMG